MYSLERSTELQLKLAERRHILTTSLSSFLSSSVASAQSLYHKNDHFMAGFIVALLINTCGEFMQNVYRSHVDENE